MSGAAVIAWATLALRAAASPVPVATASATSVPPAAASWTSVRVEPLKRLFPLLDLYYRLEPSRRTRFRLAYRLHSGEHGAPVHVSLLGDTPTILPVSSGGWFERLPTADELSGGAQVRIETQGGAKYGLSLVPEMSGPIQTVMDAATIVAAVEQLDNQVHGRPPIGLLVPHFGRVQFHGGQGAMIVAATGEARPTPLQHGQPVLTLRSLRGASRIRFDVAPERVLILPD